MAVAALCFGGNWRGPVPSRSFVRSSSVSSVRAVLDARGAARTEVTGTGLQPLQPLDLLVPALAFISFPPSPPHTPAHPCLPSHSCTPLQLKMAHTKRSRYTKWQRVALAFVFFVSTAIVAAMPGQPQLQGRWLHGCRNSKLGQSANRNHASLRSSSATEPKRRCSYPHSSTVLAFQYIQCTGDIYI